jgi:hypothetical protein
MSSGTAFCGAKGAVRGRAPGAPDDAGDLAGELLPDGVDQEDGTATKDDLAAAVRPGGDV